MTVACGGRTGSLQKADVCVYLFDRTTGALTRRLGGLPGYVQHLAYTADGRFLVVTMGKGGIRLYRLPDYAFVAEDSDYGELCRWAVSDPTGSRLATGCFDGFIRLYDLSGLTPGTPLPQGRIAPCPSSSLPEGRVRTGWPSRPMAPDWR